MRTGSTSSDILMLVVPIAVSFAFLIVISGGVDHFMTLIDVALRQAFSAAVAWARSL